MAGGFLQVFCHLEYLFYKTVDSGWIAFRQIKTRGADY
jgi:hypothetical protein